MKKKFNFNKHDYRIAVIGMGYVGLPLTLEFKKRNFDIIGFDINKQRVKELNRSIDTTKEVSSKIFKNSKKIKFTNNQKDLRFCNFFIIAVPTPINKKNKPDLFYLNKASDIVGKILKKKDIVVYESTVYPGATEENCVPILEKKSGLTFNKDFFCGYSPERINPGDKKKTIEKIVKITSGSTPKSSYIIDQVYKKIISAGTFRASSLKVAEAAKVIENTQRDLNIALINEFSIIFDHLKIDTNEILEAAGTKWNFLPFKPGLVGGHCVSVDPYYLTHKAQSLGYKPKVILAGRKINEGMGNYLAKKLEKKIIKKLGKKKYKILVLGLAFKENCSDVRNSKVVDIINYLKKKGHKVDIFDPLINNKIAKNYFNISAINYPKFNSYDASIIAVKHNKFKDMGLLKIKKFCKKDYLIFDLKNLFNIRNNELNF